MSSLHPGPGTSSPSNCYSSTQLLVVLLQSFPKQSSKHSEYRLYSIGAAPPYPSAQQIQHFLSKSKITETQLGVDHVEMLLRVLELDGEVEKVVHGFIYLVVINNLLIVRFVVTRIHGICLGRCSRL